MLGPSHPSQTWKRKEYNDDKIDKKIMFDRITIFTDLVYLTWSRREEEKDKIYALHNTVNQSCDKFSYQW